MLRASGRTAILLLAVILTVGWASPAAAQTRQFLADELLVAPKTGLSRVATEALYRRFGAELIEVLPRIDVHRIRVAPQALEALEQALRQSPHVEFVERNGLLTLEAVPNDTLYPNQWHLPKISAPAAWDLTNGSANVTIAIVDTGVDPAHPDLAAKLVPGYNAYNNNTDTSDVYGHGTQVAGTAAASSPTGSRGRSITARRS